MGVGGEGAGRGEDGSELGEEERVGDVVSAQIRITRRLNGRIYHYLRDDLTCGPCEFFPKSRLQTNGYGDCGDMWDSPRGGVVRVNAHSPACMAFKSKTEKVTL